MLPFSRCPVCGGEMVEKDVEKLLRGGIHTAVVTVRAEVCLRCGERLYSKETISRFEQIRGKLTRQEVTDFQPLGTKPPCGMLSVGPGLPASGQIIPSCRLVADTMSALHLVVVRRSQACQDGGQGIDSPRSATNRSTSSRVGMDS
jgi:YgiT-type zinc finger domain-containing protein